MNIICLLIIPLSPHSSLCISFLKVLVHRPFETKSWLMMIFSPNTPIFPSKSNIHVYMAIFQWPLWCLIALNLFFSSPCTNLPDFCSKHGSKGWGIWPGYSFILHQKNAWFWSQQTLCCCRKNHCEDQASKLYYKLQWLPQTSSLLDKCFHNSLKILNYEVKFI